MADPTVDETAAAKRLTQVAQTAYELYPKDCSHSINYVLKQLVDPGQPYEVANDLMATVSSKGSGWRQVTSLKKASDLANRGQVVIGGLASAGHGHVVVVMPGAWHAAGGFSGMREEGSYPPSMSGSMRSWPGARSNGDRTVRDPWAPRDWPNVTFWTRQ